MLPKILRRAIFFCGASENENIDVFPLRRDGGKDLIGEKSLIELYYLYPPSSLFPLPSLLFKKTFDLLIFFY